MITSNLGAEAVGFSSMVVWISQTQRRNGRDILAVYPAKPGVADVLADDALIDKAGASITEEILHIDLRPEMSEADTRPFEISFHELFPAVMRNARIVLAR